MVVKVGINGFGRIGRLAFRVASKRDEAAHENVHSLPIDETSR